MADQDLRANPKQSQSLPQSVIDEAWSEFVYPRAAVGDLAQPHPQSAFTRAMRVIEQWAAGQAEHGG